jgi:hypothetical protein
VGAVLIWLTFRLLPRRRQLVWTVTEFGLLDKSSPLTSDPDLAIFYDGTMMTAPRLYDVALTNRGRADIPSTSFDDGKPITLTFGGTVMLIPAGDSHPGLETEDAQVRIPPMLIRRRQKITVRALVDDLSADVAVSDYLVDVDVRRETDDPRRRRAPVRNVLMALAVEITALVVGGALLLPPDAQNLRWRLPVGAYSALMAWVGQYFVKNVVPDGLPPLRQRLPWHKKTPLPEAD